MKANPVTSSGALQRRSPGRRRPQLTALTQRSARCVGIACLLCCTSAALRGWAIGNATADEVGSLPKPLGIEQAVRLALAHRAEIAAARARARAAAQRPAIVSALEDPMVVPSVDHLPFMVQGVNASLTVEQRFPLSRIRGHRQRAAEQEAARVRADADRVALDVRLEVASAFLKLQERRQMSQILEEQHALAQQVVHAATARYAAGRGVQSDVLRAEIEVARLKGTIRAIAAEVRAAEAMLNTSLGRRAPGFIPPLERFVSAATPPTVTSVQEVGFERRPELQAGQSEIRRAQAEIAVMQSMYAPMAMVRTGPAYAMVGGPGWRLMLGITLPIWRGRLRASVVEAEARVAMARGDLEAMTRMVEGDVVASREQVTATCERFLALRDEVVSLAQQAFATTLAGYKAGRLPLVSVIEAAETLWSAQAELTSAELNLGLAWARLHRALGDRGPEP